MRPRTAAELLRRDDGHASGIAQHVGCPSNAVRLFGIVKDGRTVGMVARCSCGASYRRGAQGVAS